MKNNAIVKLKPTAFRLDRILILGLTSVYKIDYSDLESSITTTISPGLIVMASDENDRKKFKDLRLGIVFDLDLFLKKKTTGLDLKSSVWNFQENHIFYLTNFVVFSESFRLNIGGLKKNEN